MASAAKILKIFANAFAFNALSLALFLLLLLAQFVVLFALFVLGSEPLKAVELLGRHFVAGQGFDLLAD
jgi:hypothetical protein